MMDGPTMLEPEARLVCGLCCYHDQRMIRSGMNPQYDHFCKHPDVLRQEPETMHRTHARHIGTHDRTPDWCPFRSVG